MVLSLDTIKKVTKPVFQSNNMPSCNVCTIVIFSLSLNKNLTVNRKECKMTHIILKQSVN